MSHVQLPDFMFITELNRLSEYLQIKYNSFTYRVVASRGKSRHFNGHFVFVFLDGNINNEEENLTIDNASAKVVLLATALTNCNKLQFINNIFSTSA